MKMNGVFRKQGFLLFVVIFTFLFVGVVGCTTVQPLPSSTKWQPSQSIDFIIPYGPGGGFDIWGRQVAKYLEMQLGVSVVPKNVSGGGGSTGIETLYRSKPDGYSIGIMDVPGMMTIEYILKPAYKVKEFMPLGLVDVAPLNIFVAKDSPFGTLEDLISAGKTKEIRVGTTGVNSSLWHSAVVFAEEAGFQITPVAGYSSGGELLIALQAGDFDAVFNPASTFADGLKRGVIRGLGASGSEIIDLMPDAPLFKEVGYPKTAQYAAAHRVIVAPPGTPKEIVSVLENALMLATKESEFQEWAKNTGAKLLSIDGKATSSLINSMDALVLEFEPVLAPYLK